MDMSRELWCKILSAKLLFKQVYEDPETGLSDTLSSEFSIDVK